MVPPWQVLRENRIEVEEDAAGAHIKGLPSSARELRDLLLNFNDAVPLGAKYHLSDLCNADNRLIDLETLLDESIYCDSKHKSYQARWEAAQEARERARSFSSDARRKEETWQNFITGTVLADINQQVSRQRNGRGSKALFTNAVEIRGYLSGKQHRPQPDVCVGLSLFDEDKVSHLKGAERFDKGIVHFEKDTLSNLHTDDGEILTCRPIKSMPQLAFPWMIAEFKAESGDRDECLRQAATASHTCAKLCENLANQAGRTPLPIVAITSVGPEINVFVTYRKTRRGRRKYRMSCIWTGHVQHIWSAVQLQCIVRHLMFWALRIFKPWVTECLTECYRKDALRQDEESSSRDDSSGSRSRYIPRRGRAGRQTSSISSSSATSDRIETQRASDVPGSASDSTASSESESVADPASESVAGPASGSVADPSGASPIQNSPANSDRPLPGHSDVHVQKIDRGRPSSGLDAQANIYSRPAVKTSRRIIKVNLPQAHLYNSSCASQPQSTLKPTLFGQATSSQRTRSVPRENTSTNSELNGPRTRLTTNRRRHLSVAGQSGFRHQRASSTSSIFTGQHFGTQLSEGEGSEFGQHFRECSVGWTPPPQLLTMNQSPGSVAPSFSSTEPSQEVVAEHSQKDSAEQVEKDAAAQTDKDIDQPTSDLDRRLDDTRKEWSNFQFTFHL
ncbi:MAG: hypothetical protein M1820_007642 [Bogoriella megaspora]|nr:MAG: hypothetical protein M1820_007642 [Bogoriella megaspora]